MQLVKPLIFLMAMLTVIPIKAWCQDDNDGYAKVLHFPDKLLDKLTNKTTSINKRLEKQTAKYLQHLVKRENKLNRKLYKIDSVAAKKLFVGMDSKYEELTNRVKNASMLKVPVASQYIPYLDSVKGSLNFLNENKQFLSSSKGIQQKLHEQLATVNQLQNRLQATEQAKKFIRERKQQIKDVLSKYTHLPKGITSSYNGFSKEAYYYQAQVRVYKDILNDPCKVEKKALELLNKVPAFAAFMQQHSFLANLFGNIPESYNIPATLASLQTRGQVQQMVNNRLSTSGPNAQNILQQNIQSAQAQLNLLKGKINKLGGGNGDVELPEFNPNTQRTKSFKNRIELGSNLQTTRGNNFFPNTSDISLSAGYRVNDRSTLGVGAAYRVGLGRDIRHISLTSEGVGFRSFFDYKIKGNFWFSGGAEINYRSRFNSIQQLKDQSAWSPSALAGLSKKYSVSKKLKGEFKLLYDALWQQQIPHGQAVVFRIGYSMK